MKKIFYVLIFFFLSHNVYAIDTSCFEYSGDITWVEDKAIKVISDEVNNYYFQDNILLQTKIFKDYQKKYIWYSTSFESKWITDHDYSTFSDFDQYQTNKEFIIKFDTPLAKNTFDYEMITSNYDYIFEISQDGKTYYKIDGQLQDYDLDYLKIIFNNEHLKNTRIYEFNFFELWNYEILVNSQSKSNIQVYQNNICFNNDKVLSFNKTKTKNFVIDIQTKSYNLKLEKNPSFNKELKNEYKKMDTDWDGIVDIYDNCFNIYNPDQKDSVWNGIWDACSDGDLDGILWYLDNCEYISNGDQKDINNNSIWDACEFDKDWDSIFDSQDNCINIKNPDQTDTDNDGIWDVCDNCKLFNPTQEDRDKNTIWDACEIKEEIIDTDKDTIKDMEDNCINTPNKDQKDTDNDGIWDVCDNCVQIKNINQEDSNKNKIGDICEDIDNDGIQSYLDNVRLFQILIKKIKIIILLEMLVRMMILIKFSMQMIIVSIFQILTKKMLIVIKYEIFVILKTIDI